MVKVQKKIDEILTRRVEQILPSKEKLKDLMLKRKIKVYWGIDPTSPNLHLGHLITLKKLKEFQELGHKVILLIGDFTAQIGDPSGRDVVRKPLTKEQVKENLKGYKRQISKILDISKLEIVFNSKWLSKLKFEDILKLASHFTVQRMLERDFFQRRLKKGNPIWIHEFLYPLMQGYDSVALNVDLEIGGSDQLFNMLCGRELMKIFKKKEKFVLTTPLLLGLDGRKMSKTFQNTVNFEDDPNEMYGKIMSMKDELIIDYFKLCTDLPLNEIEEMEGSLKRKKVNPRDLKAKLAKEIVKIFYGERKAQKAQREFERVFKEKKLPSKIPQMEIKEEELPILDLLVKTKLAKSKSEAKRLILQGGVKINKKAKKNWREKIKIEDGLIIQVGKKRFIKIKKSN